MEFSKNSSKRKFIAINVYIKKKEGFQINNFTLYLKELGKEEGTQPKDCRRKEIIKITEEIKEIENRSTIEKLTKLRVGRLKNLTKLTKLQLD